MNTYKPLDDQGLLFLWQQISAQFVKKEGGKGLSSNDLTNELLEKIQKSEDSGFDGNYNSLIHQPQINGITLNGNKTLDDLGITRAITDAINAANSAHSHGYLKTITLSATEPTTVADGEIIMVYEE